MEKDTESTQPLIEDKPEETKLVSTPDEQTTTKPETKTVESNEENEAIGRLNGRIDELERKYGERQAPQETPERKQDQAPKSSHPWFRNPFVSG